MSGWIMDRMVERAIPPDVDDPDQQRIAEEAAENAIRHVVTISGIAGVLVVAALAALLYGFLPSRQVVHGPSQPSEVAARVETEDAKLRQATEEWEGKLQQVVTERDALQGKVADLERKLGDLSKPQPAAAIAGAVAQDPAERNRLQGKVRDLERQVADLTQKLQATRPAAVADRNARIPKPARSSNPPVSAEPRLAYRCVDGQTVRDPATCKATVPALPEVVQSVPDTYHCGDGRSVQNPSDCGAAVAPPPRR
jgi:polyhydroxyalkanoate synthesis regulator phasin